MPVSRKIPTEAELREWLRQIGNGFPPVSISVVEEEALQFPGGRAVLVDAVVDVGWRNRHFRFAVELTSRSTPKALDAALLRIRRGAEQLGLYPLIVTPYLSNDRLQWLEQEGVSGLDLSGNGVLMVPGEMMVWRSGAANKYPRGTAIQKIYRGNSSLVARVFLLKPRYDSVQELLAEVQERGGQLTLATVSKVSSALAEDLIIERQKAERTTQLRLLQPDKLLEELAANYQPPEVTQQFVGKCPLDAGPLTEALTSWQRAAGERIARTGADSTNRYATMAREPVTRLYCTKLASLVGFLGRDLMETTRFPNIELLETTDSSVYFDIRDDLTASPIQSFLELQAGDKRDQETAEQVRRTILRSLANQEGSP
jgi:hypothetical protein